MLAYRRFELLKKYAHGDYLDEEDRDDIYTLASMGLARIGFSTTQDKERETARLTPIGENIYNRERILKNPILRFFYSFANI